MSETFTFFFQSSSPFSQWHHGEFSAKCLFNDSVNKFANCEHWMMYNKAVLFQDTETANKILRITDPKTIKSMGRSVRNFNERLWNQHREEIVYEGNKAKFTQNQHLLNQLLATQGTTLVESSPYDRIWGIGLDKNDPMAKSRSTWRGTNLLGEILTRLRNDLMAR